MKYITDCCNLVYVQDLRVSVDPGTLPISLALVKDYLKLDATDTSEDIILTLQILSATKYFEEITGVDLITKTYLGYANAFPTTSGGFYLRRSKIQSIVGIEYLVSEIFETVDSNIYYFPDLNGYNYILLKADKSWPIDGDTDVLQNIKVTFTSGFGASSSDIPDDIQILLLQIVAGLYENRGDCITVDCSKLLNPTAKMILNKYKVIDTCSAVL